MFLLTHDSAFFRKKKCIFVPIIINICYQSFDMLLMKEIKIVGTFCTGVVLVILSMYYMSRNSTISDQVFLDNIEALSGGENGGGDC